MIVLAVAITACGDAPDDRIALTFEMQPSDEVSPEFTYFREVLFNDRVVEDISPDESGSHRLTLELAGPVFAAVRAGRAEVPLFLEPGDELSIRAESDRLPATISFEGIGSENNRFLAAYYRQVEPFAGRRIAASLSGQLNPQAFLLVNDSLAGIRQAFLNDWPEALSPAFREHFQARFTYEKYTYLLDYLLMVSRRDPQAGPLPDGFHDVLTRPGLFDDTWVEHPFYTDFLMAYLNYTRQVKAREADPPPATGNRGNYFLAAEVLDGLGRDFIQALMLGRELTYGEWAAALDLYEAYQDGPADPLYKARMQAVYERLQALTSGNPAPAFTMTDMEGKQVSLSDFLGKVVLVDFWATWCGPCMREMPYMLKLKETFAGEEDLVFMYISIDTDEQAWRQTVERMNITGVHFNTPGRERGVPPLYQVKYIPSFFVIGRDGKIFDNRPPMPASGGMAAVLQAALDETPGP